MFSRTTAKNGNRAEYLILPYEFAFYILMCTDRINL